MTSTFVLTLLGITLILCGVGLLAIATWRLVGRSTARVWPYAIGGLISAIAGELVVTSTLA